MIYIFGQGKSLSIIYDDSILSEQDKIGGVAVEALPPKENKDGFDAVLFLDENNKPYWDYQPKPKKSLEQLVEDELLTKEQYKTLTGKDFVV